MKRKPQNAPRDRDLPTAADEIDRREQLLDEALKGTFPASDPPAALTPHASRK